MINDNQLFTILKKSPTVCNIYDNEMNRIAKRNQGEFKLDQDTQFEVAKKAFNSVCKESVENLSWDECCAIFDLINRSK